MTTPTTSQHTVARWLLTTQLATAEGPQSSSTAARQVFDKLSQRLDLLITPVGSEALVRRAIHLSCTEFPFLNQVQAAPSTGSVTDMLFETLGTLEPSQAHDGVVAVLANLVALLEVFIGERLTFRLLREGWPELPFWQAVQSASKNVTGKLEANL